MKDFSAKGTLLLTERLRLRPFNKEDLADFYAYASVAGVGEMAGWPHHRTLEDSRRVLQNFISGKDVLALEHTEEGRVIGSMGLHCLDGPAPGYEGLRGRELGYVLSRDYWGQGLVPEGAMALIRHAFTQTDLDYLLCGHFAFNHQSQRVIEKCGFRFFRERLYDAKQLGRKIPGREYILLREEYQP